MAGETSDIAEMANKVADEIFKKFGWTALELSDHNFECPKPNVHSNKDSGHEHPVDVVFCYIDPYTNKRIFINTDLKSYSKKSITQTSIRKALYSLAKTIDCAKVSDQWRARYAYMQDESPEVRGMLFVYNHDGEYDRNFFEKIKPHSDDGDAGRAINLSNIPLSQDQVLHVVEPTFISYLTTIVNDMNVLHSDGKFPDKDYHFFYPELRLHKTHGPIVERPATIEMLSAPFLIIKHDEVIKYDEVSKGNIKTHSSGFLIYYNRPGDDYREFVYFFDMLSNFQILDSGEPIRVRVACLNKSQDIIPNFKKAITAYSTAWGFDEYKQSLIERIEIEPIETVKKSFSSIDIGWRDK